MTDSGTGIKSKYLNECLSISYRTPYRSVPQTRYRTVCCTGFYHPENGTQCIRKPVAISFSVKKNQAFIITVCMLFLSALYISDTILYLLPQPPAMTVIQITYA